MKTEQLLDAIGALDDSLIEQAAAPANNRRGRTPIWLRVVGMAAAAAVIISLGALRPTVWQGGDTPDAPTATTTHPSDEDAATIEPGTDTTQTIVGKTGSVVCHAAPDYNVLENGNFALYADAFPSLQQFFRSSAGALLTDVDTQNAAYSPTNIYLALAMLAELTDGETRQQILDCLGVSDIESLRKFTVNICQSSYINLDRARLLIGNSIWTDENFSYKKGIAARLADTYYASSYSGEMGSEAMNEAFRNWVNEQTNGLLKDQIQDLEFTPDTVLALASTLYMKGSWIEEFSEEMTTDEIFHALGGDETVQMMHQIAPMLYYRGENFIAVKKEMTTGSMWLVLPDEGVSVSEVLENKEYYELTKKNRLECDYAEVQLSMPLFDVSSTIDMK
ncbi:MAG: hypothetical protein IJU16_03115 [Clostridia bacterium]|nr:hypothetical protein [Clostridia bacterium]